MTEEEFPSHGHCYSPFPVTLSEKGPWKSLAIFYPRGFVHAVSCAKDLFSGFQRPGSSSSSRSNVSSREDPSSLMVEAAHLFGYLSQTPSLYSLRMFL